MPFEGIRRCAPGEILRYEEIVRFVRFLRQDYLLEKVRITGGEPLVRRGIERLVAMLTEAGVREPALTTNGQRLGTMAATLKDAGLGRVNISLDSLDAGTYRRVTGGGRLEKTLDGIRAALASGLTPVKLNMVVMRGINDTEVESALSFALAQGCEMRFLELMQAHTGRFDHNGHFVPSPEVRERLSRSFHLTAVPTVPGETSVNYVAESASGERGTVGFISPHSAPFCGQCRRLRLTADGNVVGCLARARRRPVKAFLRRGERGSRASLREAVEDALTHKRSARDFTCRQPMVLVGG
jgi:cyclic pyranopterin phosphate synthase